MPSFGLLRRVALMRTDVSEAVSTSIIRMTFLCSLYGSSPYAVTHNSRKLTYKGSDIRSEYTQHKEESIPYHVYNYYKDTHTIHPVHAHNIPALLEYPQFHFSIIRKICAQFLFDCITLCATVETLVFSERLLLLLLGCYAVCLL
jgi:hypothetical protein